MSKTPWWKSSVVYQIYPKSFNDSNGDGIGDIQGIIEKLDYLSDLGVDVLWLNPIYRSPQIDNGYDISDYRAIDPMFGSMADFDQLLEEVHKRHMRLIMDLVVNHTSNQHEWFKQARQSRDNKYHQYYIWKDGEKGQLPNNWGSSFGGPAWTFVPELGQYYLHLFAKEQPDLNWENPAVRKQVYDLMRFWLDKGIDGFRMDVISLISKRQDYANGTVLFGKEFGSYYDGAANGPRVHEFLQEMNKVVLSNYDALTVGETPHTNSHQAQLYVDPGRHELAMIFHFDHMHLDYGKRGKYSTDRFKLTDLKRTLATWQNDLAAVSGWNSLYWSNHDQPRPTTRFGNDGKYRARSAKMLGTVLYCMQGTPYIFQGEELGLKNAHFYDIDSYQDLESKSAYDELRNHFGVSDAEAMQALYLHSRDNARTPMPWNGTVKGGFTTGQPWIELNPDHDVINAKKDLDNANGVYQYYQKLIRLRRGQPLVRDGRFELLDADNEATFSYLRTGDSGSLFIAGNFTGSEQKVQLPSGVDAKILLSNDDGVMVKDDNVTLSAYGCVVISFK